MKKFMTVCLILCAIFFGLGMILLTIGTAMGARPVEILKAGGIGKSFSVQLKQEIQDEIREEIHEEIYGENHDRKPGHHNVSSGSEHVAVSYQEKFDGKISELDVSVVYGEVFISLHDGDEILVTAEGTTDTLRCRVEEGELHITDLRKSTDDPLALQIVLPRKAFREVDLHMVAGSLNVDELLAQDLDVSVEAGELEVKRFEGNEIKASCKAGELSLGLAGAQEDYNYEVEVGVGEIKIGDESYIGLHAEREIRNQAGRHVELECGAGEILVTFVP